MSTKSFTETVVINKEDVDRLCFILNDKRKIKLTKVENHKELKGKELLKFLELLK